MTLIATDKPSSELPMPPMSDNIETGFAAACGFFLIGCTTWFVASRPRAFMRVFVPAEELREVARSTLRGVEFRRSMRAMGLLQMGLGGLFAIITLVAWLS